MHGRALRAALRPASRSARAAPGSAPHAYAAPRSTCPGIPASRAAGLPADRPGARCSRARRARPWSADRGCAAGAVEPPAGRRRCRSHRRLRVHPGSCWDRRRTPRRRRASRRADRDRSPRATAPRPRAPADRAAWRRRRSRLCRTPDRRDERRGSPQCAGRRPLARHPDRSSPVPSRTSHSTGVAPTCLTASADAMNVCAGTMTSSPAPMP